MIRKAIIVVLTIAATLTSCLWVWLLAEGRGEVVDLLDFPSINIRIQHVGSNLVLTLVGESYEFPDAISGRTVIHYDTGDWRGTVSELHVEPAERVPTTDDVWFHNTTLAVQAEIRGWLALDYVATTKNLRSVMVSVWPLIPLFGLYPTTVFMYGLLRRYRRRRKGLCVKCGYNLTGNESGVCPECGTEVSK